MPVGNRLRLTGVRFLELKAQSFLPVQTAAEQTNGEHDAALNQSNRWVAGAVMSNNPATLGVSKTNEGSDARNQ